MNISGQRERNMLRGMVGKKLGMIQIFDEEGNAVGVTVVQAGPCTVIKHKGPDKVQVGFWPTKESRVTKPVLGQFKQAGVGPFKILREVQAAEGGLPDLGQEITASIFAPGEVVKVTGTSKGKGFAGVIKRWNFGGGKASHGSRSHRIPGSIGQCAYPSRVFKGRRMPGRLGGARVTVPSVTVIEVRPDENLLLLKGPVPGANGGIIFIRKS
jgi:large subunit ribosomal protein L3